MELLIQNGTNIVFSASSDGQSINTVSLTNAFKTNLFPTFTAGIWTEFACCALPGIVLVKKDGVPFIHAATVLNLVPSASARSQGFSIGSRRTGSLPARGVMDELELFNNNSRLVISQFSAYDLSAGYPPHLTASVLNNGGGLLLRWRRTPLPPFPQPQYPKYYILERKLRSEADTQYVTLISDPPGFDYHDTAAQPGVAYTYRLRINNSGSASWTWHAGHQLPPLTNRGHVMLLAATNVATALSNELFQLKEYLVGDGWSVLRSDTPVHNDSNWSANTNAIRDIKLQILSAYTNTAISLKALILIGHVPAPMTGFAAEDYHFFNPPEHQGNPGFSNHFGAWFSDLYYGDAFDGWKDTNDYVNAWNSYWYGTITTKSLHSEITINIVGDGKFDHNFIPENERLEMAVGRVDFSKLSAFSPVTEVDLLRRYLQKNHRYRHAMIQASSLAFDAAFGAEHHNQVVRDTAAALSLKPGIGFEEDIFLRTNTLPISWGYHGSGAYIDGIRGGMPNALTTADLAVPGRIPNVVFFLLTGSWIGDWNLDHNNFLRALLSDPDYGLASMWVRFNRWNFREMAFGDVLGSAQLIAQEAGLVGRTMGILGDPTLRVPVIDPVTGLTSTSLGIQVALRWSYSDTGATFLVERSLMGLDGPFTHRWSGPIAQFTDTLGSGTNLYRVRALLPVPTGLGSFTGISQGQFISTIYP